MKENGDGNAVDAKEEQMKATFAMFDFDGSGSISAAECGTVVRSLGHNPTDEEVNDLLKARTIYFVNIKVSRVAKAKRQY
jgi:Ca2+-binding EF-hand superfamily protein